MDRSFAFLGGGGAMGAATRAHDWSASSLGAIETWPSTLRNALSLMLNSPESMYLVWGADRLFFFNDAYRPILGPRLAGALGRSLPDLWADTWEQVRPAFERAVGGEAVRFTDLPLTMARYGKDEQTWWSFSYSPIYDDVGMIGGVFCTTTETTERVRSVEAVRALNATLAFEVAQRTQERDRIWQLSRDMLCVTDSNGIWRSANPAWTRVFGWDLSQLVGRTSEWLEHPDDHAKSRSEILKLRSGQMTLAFENRFRTREGLYRDLAWTAVPADELFYCVARDVTEEKKREAALRDSMDFTRLALTSVGGVGVWTFDVVSDRFFYDAAIAGLYGLDAAEAAAGIKRSAFLANVHPDDVASLEGVMAQGLERSGDLELEYRILHPDGSTRWVLSRAHTYHDEDGKAVRRTGVGIESTRQRHLEEQLRQSQKLEAVGQLTGGVAHDFNNLLTVIRSSTDLLKRPNLSEERRARYVDAIASTVDRAAKLTGQLLAFARRQALKPEVFDAGQSVRAIGDMVGTLTGARVHVTIEVPEDVCFIDADASQFDTALVNIAVNARDAMDGEGRLTISVQAVSVMPAMRSHPEQRGNYVAVAISDTGTGIPADQLERIFEPFFTTKDVGHGTGLGLSQVFGFAKQSGGEVKVESEVGRGSTFTLYLPRAMGRTSSPERASSQPAEDGSGTCVLVVEDNQHVGTFSTQTLKELGYGVHWVESASEALAQLARHPNAFDIVFSDVVMPGMNGVELGQEIGRRYPHVPVVLTSGYSQVLAEDSAHGFELLHKPYSVEALSRVLQKAVGRQRKVRSEP